MRILITNDDSYTAQGISELVEIMRPYGELTVIAPKYHQSGTSMAVDLGYKPIAVKKIRENSGERWWYVDSTPSACVKYGIDNIFLDSKPDVVISGINHGSNAASAMLYSATIGGAQEGALAGIPSFALSLDDFRRKADFSVVRKYFPAIFEKIMSSPSESFGVFYNINFPAIKVEDVKGVKLCHQGTVHWEEEYEPYDYDIFNKIGLQPIDNGIRFIPEIEEGESIYMMTGHVVENANNTEKSDHRNLANGWITIVPHNINMTDMREYKRLESLEINKNFK